MVNPLRGFISEDGRLFASFDKVGIELHEESGLPGFVSRVLDVILGRIEPITVGGDALFVDRQSAELFFSRNSDRLFGVISEEMPLKEKILRFLSELMKESRTSLPQGLFEGLAVGGKEGKRLIIGMVSHFHVLFDALEQNGFDLSVFREEMEGAAPHSFVHFERELFLDRIIESNSSLLSQLSFDEGGQEVQMFTQFLIDKIKKKRDLQSESID